MASYEFGLIVCVTKLECPAISFSRGLLIGTIGRRLGIELTKLLLFDEVGREKKHFSIVFYSFVCSEPHTVFTVPLMLVFDFSPTQFGTVMCDVAD